MKLNRLLGFLSLTGSVTAVLVACGGANEPSSSLESANVAAAQSHDQQADRWGRRTTTTPKITLLNLPQQATLETSASIRYDLTGASGSTAVYCRLDSYAPVSCPNPFILGATADQALKPGTHVVDYYIDNGAGFDAALANASYTWTVQAAAAGGNAANPGIVLTNLPEKTTLSSAASIGFALTGVTTNAKVYCRLDDYEPIACPNPFVLGATAAQALQRGTHVVEFFVDAGAGIDRSQPAVSYGWTVEAAAAAPTTAGPSAPAPASTALPFASAAGARIEAPGDADVTGYGTKPLVVNGGSVLPLTNAQTVVRSGVTRFGPETLGGRSVIRHHIRQGDPLRNSGARAELSYGDFRFANGEDIWFASAFMFASDCDPATSGGASDRMLIQQTHQDATSVMANPFSLTYVGGGASQGLNWVVAYEGNDRELYRTPIQLNQWIRTITHYRSGFAASGHAPVMEVWVAYGSGGYAKLTPVSGASATQQFGETLSTPGSNNDWPKIGLYKWTTGSWGASPSRTVYSSGLYAKKGANLLNEAAAALSAAGF